MNNKDILSKAFLLMLMGGVMYLCYGIFAPFLDELFIATVLATVFYRPYTWLTKKLGERAYLSSFLMCLAIVILVIVPMVELMVYGAQKSVEAYSSTVDFVNSGSIDYLWHSNSIKSTISHKAGLMGINQENIKAMVLDVMGKVSDWFVGGAASFIKGTTNFLVSLIVIIFTLFFLFIDGKKMSDKIMYWTPLPNRYDREIFKKFRDVSISTVISTFVTAIAQGLVAALGFAVVGLPWFFPGVFSAIFSMIPYIGTAVFWFPAAMYLFFIGHIWQGVFLILWGAGVISMVDNLIKAYIIKGKAEVHPMFVIFAILGGASWFGFWGVVIGPLIIALAVTILHIYEMEYRDVLES